MSNTFLLKVDCWINPVGVISSPTGQEQPLGFHQYPAGTVVGVDAFTAGILRNTFGMADEITDLEPVMAGAVAMPPLVPQARHKHKRASKSYRGE